MEKFLTIVGIEWGLALCMFPLCFLLLEDGRRAFAWAFGWPILLPLLLVRAVWREAQEIVE